MQTYLSRFALMSNSAVTVDASVSSGSEKPLPHRLPLFAGVVYEIDLQMRWDSSYINSATSIPSAIHDLYGVRITNVSPIAI